MNIEAVNHPVKCEVSGNNIFKSLAYIVNKCEYCLGIVIPEIQELLLKIKCWIWGINSTNHWV